MSEFVFKVIPENPELGAVTPYNIKSKCNFMRRHFDRFEKVFQAESDELWAECKREAERTKDHEDDSEHDYSSSDSLREIEFIYLRMHRYSAILASYAYLENSMNKLCKAYHKSMGLLLSPSEISGSGIVKFRTYLEKLACVDFKAINTEWSHLKDLGQIRNCIMHAEGDANLIKNRDLIDLINRDPGLSYIEESLITVEASYILKSIDAIEGLLLHLTTGGRQSIVSNG